MIVCTRIAIVIRNIRILLTRTRRRIHVPRACFSGGSRATWWRREVGLRQGDCPRALLETAQTWRLGTPPTQMFGGQHSGTCPILGRFRPTSGETWQVLVLFGPMFRGQFRSGFGRRASSCFRQCKFVYLDLAQIFPRQFGSSASQGARLQLRPRGEPRLRLRRQSWAVSGETAAEPAHGGAAQSRPAQLGETGLQEPPP